MGVFSGVVHFSMGILFLLAGYVNINDPDPLLWITLYLMGALLSFVSMINPNKIPSVVPTFLLLSCLSWMIILSQQINFEDLISEGSIWGFFETEEGREIGGLGILVLEALLILSSQSSKSNKLTGVGLTMGFVVVLSAIYAMVYLQPMMNAKQNVEHCNGQLNFIRE